MLDSVNQPSDINSAGILIEIVPRAKSSQLKKCSQSARDLAQGDAPEDFSSTVKVAYKSSRPPQNVSSVSPKRTSSKKTKHRMKNEISQLDNEIAGIEGELQL
jgi:hypothetical protein